MLAATEGNAVKLETVATPTHTFFLSYDRCQEIFLCLLLFFQINQTNRNRLATQMMTF